MPQIGVWLSIEEMDQLGYDLLCLWYSVSLEGHSVEPEQKERLAGYMRFFGGDQDESPAEQQKYWPPPLPEGKR